MSQESRKRLFVDVDSHEMEENEEFVISPVKGDTVVDQVSALHEDIHGSCGMKHVLEELDAQVADLTNDFVDLRAENNVLKEEVTMLKAILIKKDKEIEELREKAIDSTARDMRNNILLHNLPEVQDKENCEARLRSVLATHTTLTAEQIKYISFERVHRIGKASAKVCRPIVAKATYYKDRELMLTAWRKKNGFQRRQQGDTDRSQLKLTCHYPQEIMERRALNFQMVEDTKKICNPDDLTIKHNVDKLYINNQRIRPRVVKPSIDEILNTPSDEKQEMKKLKSVFSDHKLERGSTFLAQAVKVTSINEARLAYKKAVMNPVLHRATHNVLAYNVGEETGWIDDGEHSAGRILAGWMERKDIKDTCVIITRNYGGEHLGTKRFELMREVALEACEKLNAALR